MAAHRITLIIFLFIAVIVENNALNITEEMASQCSVYFCVNGYDYSEYFKISEKHTSEKHSFYMNFAVKGSSNFHILLSSMPDPDPTEEIYELVVGAGANKYTELRRLRRRSGKVASLTPLILSADEYRPFWINISRDGLFTFGIEGKELPVLSYKDPRPIQVNFFSFAAWPDVPIKVLYNCEFNEPGINDTKVVRELTDEQRLRADLLKHYNPSIFTSGDYEAPVFLINNIKSVSYDILASELTVQLYSSGSWEDSRLVWDPTEYGNITKLYFHYNEVWTPSIVVYNSKDWIVVLRDSYPTSVNYDGKVHKKSMVVSNSWCSGGSLLAHWPQDSHTCSLLVGFYDHTTTTLSLTGQSNIDTEFSSSEWDLLEVSTTNFWFNSLPSHVQDIDISDSANCLSITFNIVRKPTTYTALIYTPFTSLAIILLSTFFLYHSPMVKMYILSALLVFSTVSLFQIFEKIPMYTTNTPHIIMFFLWIITSSWFCLVFSVFVYKFRLQYENLHYRIKIMLTSSFLSSFWIPKIEAAELYSGLHNESKDVEESKYWEVLIIFFDRILFTINFIIYACLIYVKF